MQRNPDSAVIEAVKWPSTWNSVAQASQLMEQYLTCVDAAVVILLFKPPHMAVVEKLKYIVWTRDGRLKPLFWNI